MWAGTLCLIVAGLMAGHWIPLPHPEAGSQLITAETENAIQSTNDDAAYFTFHFLYSDCPCSRRALTQVVKRKPIAFANERIVLVGNNSALETSAIDQGYEVEVVTPETLKSKYGVESAPLLVVTDERGKVRYAGGYTSRKQGLDFQDTRIITDTISGKTVDGLPLYGCAVSKNLKAIIDPLNLKY
jgi:hypothetical protein